MLIYLYRCFDRDGQLLYVGITDDVERRKREHAKEKFWWPDVAKVTTMAFETREAALWAEWAVITTCHPVYNKAAVRPATPDHLPPGVVVENLAGQPPRYWRAVREAAIRFLRPEWYGEPAQPEQLHVATTIRCTGDKVDRLRVPAQPPDPHRRPTPVPVAVVVAAPPAAVATKSLERTWACAYKLISAAGAEGITDGMLEHQLKAAGFDVPRHAMRGWLSTWIQARLVVRTPWDTFARSAPRADPGGPVSIH